MDMVAEASADWVAKAVTEVTVQDMAAEARADSVVEATMVAAVDLEAASVVPVGLVD